MAEATRLVEPEQMKSLQFRSHRGSIRGSEKAPRLQYEIKTSAGLSPKSFHLLPDPVDVVR